MTDNALKYLEAVRACSRELAERPIDAFLMTTETLEAIRYWVPTTVTPKSTEVLRIAGIPIEDYPTMAAVCYRAVELRALGKHVMVVKVRGDSQEEAHGVKRNSPAGLPG